MKKLTKIIIVSLIVLIIVILIYFNLPKNPYSFNGNEFSYSENRPSPDYHMALKEKNDSYDIYSVDFQSRSFLNYSTRIYSLLFMPNNRTQVPGLIFLPGGGVTKEGFIQRASEISSLGYAVLVPDQRGIGQTDGIYLNPEQDYEIFAQGKEPIQHLAVYDALTSFDVLRELKNIDKNDIAIAGESMGGRYALIAAAMEKRLKGVILISVSGFHIKPSYEPYSPYLVSIDPDHYISRISPNPIFMLQGDNDSVVKPQDANLTFSLAKEPKRFFMAEGCNHGYCEKMKEEFNQDLKALFKR